MSTPPQVVIVITKKRQIPLAKSRQKYRFKIISAGNRKALSVSNDAYVNVSDCLKTAYLVTGSYPEDWRTTVVFPR